jgi:WS/DGAT C-terminal domain
MPARMTAVDAQFYWMSAKVPSDEYTIYVFDGEPTDLDHAIHVVRSRAQACPALTVRVEDGSPLTYPRWVPTAVGPDRFVRHRLGDASWGGCQDAVIGLLDDPLDVRQEPWRLHVFSRVHGLPGRTESGGTGPGTVLVMQTAHALADGLREAELAGWLFGRAAPVPEVTALSPWFLPWRGVDAARAHRMLVRDMRAGSVAAPLGPRPPQATNARPVGSRSLRTLVRHRSQLRGPSVTVAALAAVSGALSAHLGEVTASLVAEVPMAKPGVRHAHNHFLNITVGLYPDLDRQARFERIAADLANGRRRAEHPAACAADRAFAGVPAPLLRWGISQFDPDFQPSQVSGNTVVTSVYRGPGDLSFGGVPVLLVSGCPTLSPAMGLTHAVYGIGDTVALGVHAAESAIGDIDDYVARLDAEL